MSPQIAASSPPGVRQATPVRAGEAGYLMEGINMTQITKSVITVRGLARIIDSADVFRRHHCYKVERYALLVCQKLELTSKDIRIIKVASMLHDVGKIGIDLTIIKKPGKLTPEEWMQVRLHPEIGANMVGQLGFLENAAAIIRHHHSRFNGGGYPDASISGENIPMGSRIISVVDSFDAMTSDRPYRKAITREAAFLELKRCAGHQFDPRVVDAFLSAV
jgi:putative nucleotidyltransferase with HDIG domain